MADAERAERAPDESSAFRYIETSALLAALLERAQDAREALRGTGRRVTSTLTVAEAHRAITRARATSRLTAAQARAADRALRTFFQRCDLVGLSDDILARAARPFPIEPVRTLDALHLATLEALGEPPSLVAVVTRDNRVRANAHAMGFAVE